MTLLTTLMAAERQRDLVRAADERRRSLGWRLSPRRSRPPDRGLARRETRWDWRQLFRVRPGAGGRSAGSVTIRYARTDDEQALRRLAAGQASALAPGPWLVAQVDLRIWAAVQVHGAANLADPLLPTGELVWRLHEYARRLRKESLPSSLASELLLPDCPEPHWFDRRTP